MNYFTSDSALVSYLQGGSGSMPRSQQSKNQDVISVADFGILGDNLTDNTAKMAALQSYLAGLTVQPIITWPQGIYLYSASPNWALNHARHIPLGEVRLRYTGAVGTAVVLDAGAGSQNIYDVTFGLPGLPFIIETTVANAAFLRAVHHSKICVKPRGAGVSGVGLLINFAVCTDFWVTCSVNEDGGWYSSARPAYGINATQRGVGEQVSYCNFHTPIIEGPSQNGIYLDGAIGNIFHGGTSEACGVGGVFESANAGRNRFVGMDFEVNTTYDVDSASLGSKWEQCDSNTLITLRGNDQIVDGGVHSQVTISAAALHTRVHNLRYNRNNNSSTISDSGTLTEKRSCVNYASGALDQDVIPNISHSSGAVQTPTIGANPWTYRNTNDFPVQFIVSGGTITNIQFSRDGTNFYSVTGATNGADLRLAPGDYVQTFYSVAPTTAVAVPM